jgi:hypothetical protein
MKMAAAGSFETLIFIYKTARCYYPETRNMNYHRREEL